MDKFRTIYVIKAYNFEGELVAKEYARNRKLAEKTAREFKRADVYVDKLSKKETESVNADDVRID